MARLYGLLSQASGSLAVALLAVALAAAASRNAFADTGPSPCACLPEETQEECDARCLGALCSHGACTTTCGPGVFPQCGTGACDKTQFCKDNCPCKLTANYRFCECQSK